MVAWDGLDRRKFPRVKCPCVISLKNDQEQKDIILTHTENIGLGGACFILKKNIKIFTPVEVEIDMMDMIQNIKCQGKVVWSIRRKMDSGGNPLLYDIGVEFVSLNDEDQERLLKVIQGGSRPKN